MCGVSGGKETSWDFKQVMVQMLQGTLCLGVENKKSLCPQNNDESFLKIY